MKSVAIASLCAAAAVLVCLPRGAESAQTRSAVPVMVGGREASEGCAGTAVVATAAGGTLNLRAGPGFNHPVIARLAAGRSVSICQRLQGGWVGILVHRSTPGARDCGVSDAGSKPMAYTGACDSGWVSEKYLRILAG